MTVTEENLAAIRALETRLREEYDTSHHEAESVEEIAVGDIYTFGGSEDDEDDWDEDDDSSDDDDVYDDMHDDDHEDDELEETE